jgi:hypothetical protein
MIIVGIMIYDYVYGGSNNDDDDYNNRDDDDDDYHSIFLCLTLTNHDFLLRTNTKG